MHHVILEGCPIVLCCAAGCVACPTLLHCSPAQLVGEDEGRFEDDDE